MATFHAITSPTSKVFVNVTSCSFTHHGSPASADVATKMLQELFALTAADVPRTMRLVFTRHNRGSTWQISKDHHGLSGGAAFVNSKAGQELHVEAHPGHLMKLVPNSTCCLQSREKSSKQEEQFHHQIRSFPLHTWYLHTFQLLDQLEDAKVKGMSVLAKDCFSIWPSSCWMDQNEARLRS